jgi:hypothetical protein
VVVAQLTHIQADLVEEYLDKASPEATQATGLHMPAPAVVVQVVLAATEYQQRLGELAA